MKLIAEGLTKKYPRKTGEASFFYAVQGASLELVGKTVTAIIGKSGSGKTTLLNMLCSLLQPSEGAITLDDMNIYDLSDAELSAIRNAHFGIIPQLGLALGSLNTLENILLPGSLTGNADELKAEALSLMKQLSIDELADTYPDELSGGELRRLSIARALVTKPEFIFADEPTGDLDDENTAAVLSLLKNYAESGAAVLMVTHDPEALKIADTIYKMNAGLLELQ